MKLIERYIVLRKQAPPEWAVRIEQCHGAYMIRRCVGIGAFSFLYGGKTFKASLDALEMLITGHAIGAGIRE